MKIVTLVENVCGAPGCVAAHGLSFYIETERHRLLMDAGPGAMLADNARALGVDLSGVDVAVLSHGHHDHADGLPTFAAANGRAPVYLRESALLPSFSVDAPGAAPRYIGIVEEGLKLKQLAPVRGTLKLDDELTLFGDIAGRRCWPRTNLMLKRQVNGEIVQDTFDHEQCLLITENGRRVLLSGCAHNGILNILERCREVCGAAPDVVISGFHMMKQGDYDDDERATILGTAEALLEWPCQFYTCHCTGLPAYEMMRAVMGDRLRYIRCGETLVI